MNGGHAEVIHTHTRTESSVGTGGSVLEASGGIATIALSIVGLAGIFRPTMAAIATIVLGASILSESGVNLAGFGRNWALPTGEEAGQKAIGAAAGIVLGILALIGLAPTTLLAVAVIVYGGTFFVSRQVLAGIAGVVLGILAVVGLDPWTLVLVGLLSLGAWTLLGGSALATQAVSERSAT